MHRRQAQRRHPLLFLAALALALALALEQRGACADEVVCKGRHAGGSYCTWKGIDYRVTAVPTTFEATPHLFRRESMPW